MVNFTAALVKLTEVSAATGRPCPSLTAPALPPTHPKNEAPLSNWVLANLKLILRAHCLVSPGVSLLKESKRQARRTEVSHLLSHHGVRLTSIPESSEVPPACCPFSMLPALSSMLKSLPNSKVASNSRKLCVSSERGLTWSQLHPLYLRQG